MSGSRAVSHSKSRKPVTVARLAPKPKEKSRAPQHELQRVMGRFLECVGMPQEEVPALEYVAFVFAGPWHELVI